MKNRMDKIIMRIMNKKMFFIVLAMGMLQLMFFGTTCARDDMVLSSQYVVEANNTVELSSKNITVDRNLTADPVIIVRPGGTLKMTNDTLVNLQNNSGKAANKVESGGTLILDNAEISNATGNQAESYLMLENAELQIINDSRIINNRNTKSIDGNIIRMVKGKLTIKDSEISNNPVTTQNDCSWIGVISTDGTSISIENSLFEGNSSYSGGCSHAKGTETFTVSGSTFRNNTSSSSSGSNPDIGDPIGYYGGGAIAVKDGNLLLAEGNLFDGNSSSACGGAVHAYKSTVTVQKNNLFTNNRSTQRGGVIQSRSSIVEVTGSVFTGNYSYNGGAIYHNGRENSESYYLPINGDCIFSENSAGAIGLINSRLNKISGHNIFSKNTSQREGGAISARGYVEIGNSEFIMNEADIHGGAIYTTEVEVTLNGALFDRNRANKQDNTEHSGMGGAISVFWRHENASGIRSTVTINEATFTNNIAESNGGAISTGYKNHDDKKFPTINIKKAVFENNQALDSDGGAISLSKNGEFYLKNIIIMENSADGYGGAIASGPLGNTKPAA